MIACVSVVFSLSAAKPKPSNAVKSKQTLSQNNANSQNNSGNNANVQQAANNQNMGMENNAGQQQQGVNQQAGSQQGNNAAQGQDQAQGQVQGQGQGQENAAGEDEEDEGKAEPESDAFFYDVRRNPHPRFPSSHATKRLILTFQKPKEEKLNLCVKEFRAAADTATNADSMVQTMKLMTAAVSKNVKFYHWCFYHFVSALDWKLEEDSLGLQLQDKMTIFTKNMKGLWLLARSMDEAVGSHIYFDFIKVRYIELSLAHFGRSLDVISPPLGDPRWIEPTKYFRPAGAFEK